MGTFPSPGQQLVDAFGGMIGQSGKDIREPSLRVNVIELGGRNQGVDGGGATPAFVGAGESPVVTSERDGAQLSLSGIVGHAQAPVINEARECSPALETIIDGFADIAVPRNPGALLAE